MKKRKANAASKKGAPATPRKWDETKETLRAIRNGQVDAVVVSRPEGERLLLLSDTEDRWRALIEQIDQGVATLTGSSAVYYCNGRLAEILGATQEELLGTSFSAFVQEDDLRLWEELLQRAVQGSSGGEIRLKTPSQERVSVRVSLRAVGGEAKHPDRASGVNLVVTEIGERQLTEDETRLMAEHLEQVRERTAELEGANRGLLKEIAKRKRVEEALRESEERFRLITEYSRDLISMIDQTGRYVYVSPSHHTILGYSSEELLSTDALKLVHPDDLARLENWQNANHFEFRARKANGEWVWLEGSTYPVQRQGEPFIVAVARVIAERKQAENQMQQSQQELRQWIEELELRNREITLLSEMVNLFQACRTDKEAYAVIAEYTQRLFPDEAGALYVLNESRRLLESVAAWGSPLPSEAEFEPSGCWALRRGRLYLVQDRHSPMVCSHLSSEMPRSYMCIPMVAQSETLGILTLHSRSALPEQTDVSPLIESKQKLAMTVAEHIALALANLRLREALRRQAIRDPLTNLYNRRYMEETLERELYRARREGSSLGIIMLDVDHFKEFNDAYGHEAGDLLLQQVAHFVEMHVRKEDVACRFGGEEFTLILPEDALDKAQQRAEELRAGVQSLVVKYNGEPLGPITLSFGVAIFPDHGSTAEALLRAADAALYRAKATGRDRVIVAEMNETRVSRAPVI